MHERIRDRLHAVEAARRHSASGVDNQGGPPNDGGMEARVKLLEDAMLSVKTDLAVIKATHATKEDIQGTKRDISEAKSSIIMWVVGAVFLAQLLPALPAIIGAIRNLAPGQ